MSVARLPPPLPSTDLADAAGKDERVILHCLSCGRSRDAQARIFLGLLGAIPFGMLIGKLRCSRCKDKLGVLLPWYAPTPRDWVKQYKAVSIVPERYVEPPAHNFIFQVESVDQAGAVVQTTTLTRKLNVATFGFEEAVKTARVIDRFWLREGTRLLRDSLRDLKVIKG